MVGKMNQTLGDVIREKRTERKRSLRDMAREIGISPSYQSDIENDRRVPAEETLQKIATLLELSFDDLMALAGRIGEQAERYMRRNPAAGILFRKISEKNLSKEHLQKLLDMVNELEDQGDDP